MIVAMKIFLLIYEIFITAIAANEDTEIEKSQENVHKNASSPFGAALFDLSSWVFLCNGALYSPIFIFTSCRCLTSGIAIAPHYIKRNASKYGLGILFRSDDQDEDVHIEYEIRTGVYRIQSFILHPFCFRTKVSKPYQQHFGLIVLKGRGMGETVSPLAISERNMESEDSSRMRMCRIIGIHTEDGQLTMKETEMVLMTSEECLWRLCVPKIGCTGRDNNIGSRRELCLTRVDDMIPKLGIYEGSQIKCNGEGLGLIVSTGRIRYPQAPLILASFQQFVDSMPINFQSQKNGPSRTSVHGLHFLTMALLLIPNWKTF